MYTSCDKAQYKNNAVLVATLKESLMTNATSERL